MTIGTGDPPPNDGGGNDDDDDDIVPASLIDALLVYAEPLAAGAHAVVVGDAESGVAERLLDLGARSIHIFDPDPARAANAARNAQRGVTVRALVDDDLDVRDGAFDLAVVPDLAELNDPRTIIARLRRAVARSGAVVAMGRAKVATEANSNSSGSPPPFAADLGPAALEYAELYDLFAGQFDEVSLAGVVPFNGVVFAELGTEDDAPAVSVDTRLATSADPPSVFVVVAAQETTDERDERPALDPYAIVQVPLDDDDNDEPLENMVALETAFAAMQLKAELLSTQLDEVRDRLVIADVRSVETAGRLDRASAERDGALTRAMELEAVLAASQQTMATLERRLLEAEQGMLERDDRIAVLSAEMDVRRSPEAPSLAESIDTNAIIARAERAEAALALANAEMAAREENAATYADTKLPDITGIVARAERAEAALALNVADLAHIAGAHAAETASYEEQLRDRARFVAALEKELVRREQLVKELVASLEESREGANGARVFEAAAPMSAPPPPPPPPAPPAPPAAANGSDEIDRLKRKLDELASEVARREGELVARAWRITELENALSNASSPRAEEDEQEPTTHGRKKPVQKETSKDADARGQTVGAAANTSDAETALGRARDELDALRQALAQEHAARLAAESGEELARARSELAHQAALLEQIRGRSQDAG